MVKLGKEHGPKFAILQKQPLRQPNTKGIEEVSIEISTYWVQGGTKKDQDDEINGLEEIKKFKEPKGEEIYYEPIQTNEGR